MSFLAELRRRNVIRVSVAYAIIGWILAQVAEFAFENFGAPDWVLKSVVVVLLLGLPIAVFFAWAFEVTPEGIKREEDVDRSESVTSKTGHKLNILIIACLLLVAVLIVAQPYLPGVAPQGRSNSQVTAEGDSIAVLPFADLSEMGDQEFFLRTVSLRRSSMYWCVYLA